MVQFLNNLLKLLLNFGFTDEMFI